MQRFLWNRQSANDELTLLYIAAKEKNTNNTKKKKEYVQVISLTREILINPMKVITLAASYSRNSVPHEIPIKITVLGRQKTNGIKQ